MNEKSKEFFMKKALEQAQLAYSDEEVPVGAVVVLDDEVVGQGCNAMIKNCDPSAHAEIAALRSAGSRVKNYRLTGCEVFVTLEPCLMCYSALVQARISKLYFAAFDDKAGIYSTGAFDRMPAVFNHSIRVEPGIMQEESTRLLKRFFLERRGAGAVERDGLENR